MKLISNLHVWFSDLVVASPVEDYFLYVDELPSPYKVRMHALYASKILELQPLQPLMCMILNDRRRQRKLPDPFWMFSAIAIQSVVKVCSSLLSSSSNWDSFLKQVMCSLVINTEKWEGVDISQVQRFSLYRVVWIIPAILMQKRSKERRYVKSS